MKKHVMGWLMAVSFVIVSGASILQADVLYFEDITTGGTPSVPSGYGGFSWVTTNTSFYVVAGHNYPNTGFLQCVTATGSDYCTMGGKISDITRPDERQFNFTGAWFSAAYGSNVTLWITGTYHGEVMYNQSISLNNTSASWFEFNYEDVDHLHFSASDFFAMDNFTYSLTPVEYPRGEVVVDFDDRYMGGSDYMYLPLGFKGILWDENVWIYSEYNYEIHHPDAKYAVPHSWDKFVFNYGQGYIPLGFSFDPEIYPEAVLLGAWFSRVQSPTADANEIRIVGYDGENVVAATEWLVLTNEPQYLEAIDAATGEPFGYMTRLEVNYIPNPDYPDSYHKFAMDDLTFLSDPIVLPVANAGGPYVAQATDWNSGHVTLDGSASEAQGEATIAAYAWDLDITADSDGDGDPANDVDLDEPNAVVTTDFALGQTSIALVVTDSNGEQSEPVTTTVTVSSYTIEIDIRPYSDDNVVVLRSWGMLPVAFLTDASFDATTIDPTTVTLRDRDFSDGLVKIVGRRIQRPMSRVTDVDEDGDLDLVVTLDIEKLAEGDVETECEIGGLTYDGYVVSGTDTIRIIHRRPW